MTPDLNAFNCGGFALNTFDWVVPYKRVDDDQDHPDEYTEAEREEFIMSFVNAGYSREEIAQQLLMRDAAFLLIQYPELQIVNPDKVDIHDRLIAYRVCVPDTTDEYFDPGDVDFHFRVRINGFWFEKCGTEGIYLCTGDIQEPWQSTADLIYDSAIFYFVQKKN